MTRAISIGECMVELRAEADGRLRRSFAGDAYNTAVYLKRSAPGIDVAFLTATGDDSISGAMRDVWRGEGVSDDTAFTIAGGKPGLYLIETDAKGDRRFHYWRGESAARQWYQALLRQGGAAALDGADLIYISGISLAILSPQDRAGAIALLTSLKTRIAFDPNIRMALWESADAARACLEAMLHIASIALPSRQDLDLLYGITDPAAQMEKLAALTRGEIALTTDADGCLIRSRDGALALPAAPVARVVDTSGAGDSFNGAYLAARLGGAAALDAARAGLALAARVVAEPGAIIGKSP